MFGKSVLLLFSFAALFLIGAMTISCGGSSSSTVTKACTGGPYNVVGPWQITATGSSGSFTGYGAIDSAGLALFFDAASLSMGDTVQLPTITGACSFSGNITAYAEPGSLPPGTNTVAIDPATGNVTSSSALNGSFTSTAGAATFSASASSPLTGSVTALTGSMQGQLAGSINNQGMLLPLTFSQSGSNNSMIFSTTNLTNCVANGTFTEQGTGNVFDVSITLAQGCPITGTFSGIGFESSTDYFGFDGHAVTTYLYADILASSNTFVLEIYPFGG